VLEAVLCIGCWETVARHFKYLRLYCAKCRSSMNFIVRLVLLECWISKSNLNLKYWDDDSQQFWTWHWKTSNVQRFCPNLRFLFRFKANLRSLEGRCRFGLGSIGRTSFTVCGTLLFSMLCEEKNASGDLIAEFSWRTSWKNAYADSLVLLDVVVTEVCCQGAKYSFPPVSSP